MSSYSLKELFLSFGEIIETVIISDSSTGRSKGFGFITFATEKDAKKALAAMNDKDIEGQNIVVNTAKAKEDRNSFRMYGNYKRGG